MTEKDAINFEIAVNNNLLPQIKPFKSMQESPYIVFDVNGKTCFTFSEALETVVKQNNSND